MACTEVSAVEAEKSGQMAKRVHLVTEPGDGAWRRSLETDWAGPSRDAAQTSSSATGTWCCRPQGEPPGSGSAGQRPSCIRSHITYDSLKNSIPSMNGAGRWLGLPHYLPNDLNRNRT